MHRPRYHQTWVDFRESNYFIPDIPDLQGRNPKKIGPIVQEGAPKGSGGSLKVVIEPDAAKPGPRFRRTGLIEHIGQRAYGSGHPRCFTSTRTVTTDSRPWSRERAGSVKGRPSILQASESPTGQKPSARTECQNPLAHPFKMAPTGLLTPSLAAANSWPAGLAGNSTLARPPGT